MDFNSWQPEDSARRYAIMLGCCVGVFTFLALWLGLPLNFFLAALAGIVAGMVVYAATYPLLLAVFRR